MKYKVMALAQMLSAKDVLGITEAQVRVYHNSALLNKARTELSVYCPARDKFVVYLIVECSKKLGCANVWYYA